MQKNFELGKCDLQKYLFGMIDFFLNRQSNSIYQAKIMYCPIYGLYKRTGLPQLPPLKNWFAPQLPPPKKKI